MPVLADVTIGGQARKVVMVANRNGFFYVLDRVTGKLILGKPFTATQWARELGPDGKPIVLSQGAMMPGDTKEPPCVPDFRGGTNFNPPSYDPALQFFFVMARETCAIYTPIKQEPVLGRVFMSGGMKKLPEPDYGAVRALDIQTGAIKWEFKLPTPSLAGRDVHRIGSGVRRRQRGHLPRLRRTHRQGTLVVSHGIAHLGCGADDRHARRPPARAAALGKHARRRSGCRSQ